MRALSQVVLAFLVVASIAAPSRGMASGEPNRHDHDVTIAFTGDTLIHLPLSTRAWTGEFYDFKSMFTKVRPILAGADLAICHLEVPLSPTNQDLKGYPRFSAPHELADALAFAGYDGCSTASNHSYDRGSRGVLDTIEILQDAGLVQAGMAATSEDGWEASFYQVGGLTLAHISATYWLNGLRMPEDQQWLVQQLDVEEILGIAARSRRSGADLVVASIHCCVEYLREPTPAQQAIYKDLIASPDIDLLIGHHSHMVGPIERFDGEFILYGLGNFLSLQRSPVGVDDGLIAMIQASHGADGWSFTDVEIVPTWVVPGTSQIVPALMVNRASYDRTMTVTSMYERTGFSPYIWFGHPGARLPS